MNPNTVFVILWYNNKADPKVIEYNNGNRTEIASKLVGRDNVVFSAIDMGIDEHVNGEHHNTDYSVLFNIINGKKWSEDQDYVLKTGPIVNVVRKSKGVKITGKGIPDETNDQVESNLGAIKRESSSGSSGESFNTYGIKTQNTQVQQGGKVDNIDKAYEPTQGSVFGF